MAKPQPGPAPAAAAPSVPPAPAIPPRPSWAMPKAPSLLDDFKQLLTDAGNYCRMDGFYRCIVTLSERDSLTLRAIGGGALTDSLGALMRMADSLTHQQGEDDALAGLVRVLGANQEDGLWAALETITTEAIVSVDAPELAEVYGAPFKRPSDLSAPSERMTQLRRLPAPVLARIIIAVFWQLKNSSGSSTRA